MINGGTDNEGGEIARKGGGGGGGNDDGVSIMNNALLKMKTRLRFLDYNPTGNSDKSPQRGGKGGLPVRRKAKVMNPNFSSTSYKRRDGGTGGGGEGDRKRKKVE